MERAIAVLIDFENLATGCEKEGLGRFDLRVVMRRMKDKGRILVARAYADWGQWARMKQDLFEQGVAMAELSTRGNQAKNRADMALCVDAMELAFTRDYLDTFVILSGDSDFTPLVMRLKELNKSVIGCGTRGSTSHIFANLCDEFYFYETLQREVRAERVAEGAEPAGGEGRRVTDAAFDLLLETLENHQRDEGGPVHAGVLKSSMKRKVPTFSEVELGYRTFARFLEAAADKSLVTLRSDDKAGGYRVEISSSRDNGDGEGRGRAERGGPERDDRPIAPRGPGRSAGTDSRRERSEEPRRERSEEPRRERSEEPRRERSEEPRREPAEATAPVDDAVRTRVLGLLVDVAQERAARGKRCTMSFAVGEILRMRRDAGLSLSPRDLKGILRALLQAGALRDAAGNPVAKDSAAFEAPESVAALQAYLDASPPPAPALDSGAAEADAPLADVHVSDAHVADASADIWPDTFGAGTATGDGATPPEEPQEEARRPRKRRGGRRGRGGGASPAVDPDDPGPGDAELQVQDPSWSGPESSEAAPELADRAPVALMSVEAVEPATPAPTADAAAAPAEDRPARPRRRRTPKAE